jgi:alkylated DNA nucleotide flippase Atl1
MAWMKHKTYNDRLKIMPPKTRVERIKGFRARFGSGTIAIPASSEVEEIMRAVPKGKLITTKGIQEVVARRHKASIGCPILTGVGIWLVAHAAHEQGKAGKKRIVPYWRTIRNNGDIAVKSPGSRDQVRKLLQKEGHKVVVRGKRYRVLNYQDALVSADEIK